MRESRAAWAALLLALLAFARPGCERWPAPPPLPAPHPGGEGAAVLLWGGALDLNRSRPADLQVLPGIGALRAAALVEGRPYCAVEEILRVRGIGPATLARLRGQLAAPAPPPGCRAAPEGRVLDGGGAGM